MVNSGKFLLIALWLLVFAQVSALHAQLPVFTNVSNEMGVPGNTCYAIFQDSKGFIWISSADALLRCTGNTTTIFSADQGITGNVTGITEDRHGVIWFTTDKNQVFRYIHNRLEEAPFSRQLQQKAGAFDITYSIGEMPGNQLYISTAHNSFAYNTASGSLKKMAHRDSSSWMYFVDNSKQYVPVNGYTQFQGRSPWLSGSDTVQLCLERGAKKHYIRFRAAKEDIFLFYQNAIRISEYDVLSAGQYLLILKNDRLLSVTRMDHLILNVYADPFNRLWVGTNRGGVVLISHILAPEKQKQLLPGAIVTQVMMDYEQHVWCSTLNEGVLKTIGFDITEFDQPLGDKLIWNIQPSEGKLLLLSTADALATLDGDDLRYIPLPATGNDYFQAVWRVRNNLYLAGDKNLCKTDPHFNTVDVVHMQLDQGNFGTGVNGLCTDSRGTIYAVTPMEFCVLSRDTLRSVAPLPQRATCLSFEKETRFLVGTVSGLFRYHLKSKKFEEIPGIRGKINTICRIAPSHFLIATASEGLFELKNQVLQKLSLHHGLPSLHLSELQLDERGNVWMASSREITGLNYAEDGTSSWRLNTRNGLPIAEIVSMVCISNTIYFMGRDRKKLYRMNVDHLLHPISPVIHLREVQIGKSKRKSRPSGMLVPWDENEIRFRFDVVSFQQPGNAQFSYILKGPETKTGIISGDELYLEKLQPGDYLLVVEAYNALPSEGHAVEIRFSVQQAFFTTWWFVTLCLLTGILLVVLFVRFQIRRVKKREANKTRIHRLLAESNLKAIQAQMNPHFTFNAINSIQRYILEEQKDNAFHYLEKFSRLIRMVLQYSEEQLISIEEECDLLRLYLELEQLRFDNKFRYDLYISEDVDVYDVILPTMLIQPYIENAIWHGFMNLPKDRSGLLKISFSPESEDQVQIVIEDNGVGRSRAAELKGSSTHRSMGTSLNQRRIENINEMQKDIHVRIETEDLMDTSGHAAGTRVIIHIHKLHF